MAMACISATDLTVAFDPNPPVFQALDVHLAAAPVALIGPNGAGKTVLAECLAGTRSPTAGLVQHQVPVAFLPQQAAEQRDPRTVAAFLGVETALAALARLLAGEGRVDDLSILNDRWTLKDELQTQLAQFQLPTDILSEPVSSLSGGQRTRLHLMKLSRLPDTYLILDEPTNHLDQSGRQWLADWVKQRDAGTLVITHDQGLLASFSQLLELREGRLQRHGQGFAEYQRTRAQLIEKARHDKQHARQTLRKERQQQQLERERHEQRAAKGKAKARKGDMPKILLDARKDRSEATGGRIAQKHQAVLDSEQQRLEAAESVLERKTPLAFPLTEPPPITGWLLALRSVRLPWIENTKPLNWQVMSGERWWLRGANGSGKSTLLSVISGDIEPVSGDIQQRGTLLRLDQHLTLLTSDQSALANFRRLNPGWSDAAYRDRLAQLKLRGDLALQPVAQLSGGEQLKVALACSLMGPEAAQLILLDEPDNHLDLESQTLLAEVLSQYRGTLIVVTHSEPMAQAMSLDQVQTL
ncbi:ATPase subunit of ABC transporter with duplicated ATPase domains [Natronospira proteinivora]|uniref:ATPase subunit of ABC transporter with duplicated ATPase domains n=1 Tax=Natronospira proteinivora TaxID=1807133 RepID=A0ABT1G7G1_9GAMM|nr:ATP-binding cassette domain-containing protein [Natronospira proteinivora]MCP1727241.1 ATPase subunit of ABC transporter with duplicated ATPase domains [Natronospira proteinivora]